MTNKKGFTLIELLVVIAIIGILSAIGLVSLNGAREKARDSQRKSDIGSFRSALALYFDDFNSYPTTSGKVDHGASGATGATGGFAALIAGNYMPSLPNPPATVGTIQGTYYYAVASGNDHFLLYSQLEKPVTAGNHYVVTDQNAGESTSTTCGSTCP